MPTTLIRAVWTTLAFAGTVSLSNGMISFGYLSPAEAKEAGVEVRYRAAGPRDVWVEITFPTHGKWQAFAGPKPINYVQLHLDNKDGTLGLRANLREDRSAKGRVGVSFTVERTKLHQVSIWITRRVTDVADVLRMKEFIVMDEIDQHHKFVPPRPVEKEAAEAEGDELPASESPETSVVD